MTTTQKKSRPTFYFNNQPVRAAGLLINIIENNKKYFLLRSTKHSWSDMGGKTDAVDSDIISTIVRETTEETNNHLFSAYHNYEQAYGILDNVLRNEELQIFYCPKAKYVLIKVELDSKLKLLPMKRFGLLEGTDKMNHYYKWISDIKRFKMHPRLRYHRDFNKIFK